MKLPPRIPDNVRVLDREAFLGAMEPSRRMLLGARSEAPGVHILAIFTDASESRRIIEEVGPEARYRDLKQAIAAAPAENRLAYIVPCVACPPIAIPPHLARSAPPPSLANNLSAPAPAPSFATLTAATPPVTPIRPETKFDFALSSEKKPAIRLPDGDAAMATRAAELERKRAEFETEYAVRLRELEGRDRELSRREHDLELKTLALRDIVERIEAFRRRFPDLAGR